MQIKRKNKKIWGICKNKECKDNTWWQKESSSMVDILEHDKNMECGKYNEGTGQKQGAQQRQWVCVAKTMNAKMKKKWWQKNIASIVKIELGKKLDHNKENEQISSYNCHKENKLLHKA